MRKAALAALLLVLVPLQAQALQADELLGLVAMPLAVAAASEVTGVPVGELSHFVATLNRAQVPPTQIVQVVRYAPAALVIEDQQPLFVEYVDTQVERGVVGSQLVTVIEERYRTYDLEPNFIVLDEPATTYVVRDDYIPPLVVTRVAQVSPSYLVRDTNDLLALAAMPLAVAAVADITGVPFTDLAGLVASLNAARLPPMQIVEVLRYAPVALADDYNRPRFVQFVETRVADGFTGPRLVRVIGDQLRTYDVDPQFGVLRPAQIVVVDDDFFPAVVTTRVAQVRAHPHGGPPGQLKKDLGLQTGAEVVHGTRPGVVAGSRERAVRPSRVEKPGRVEKPKADKPKKKATAGRSRAVERREISSPGPKAKEPKIERKHRGERSDGGRGHGGYGKGQGQGKGKGKGKG